MTNLIRKSCQACQGKERKLTKSELDNLKQEVPSWSISQDQKWLEKEFKFKDFAATINFINKIGKIAEQEFHHPNFNFTWGYCKIKIQTHKINALCESDFILAAKIDTIS